MKARDGVLLVFVDGVGIGRDDPEVNPFVLARERAVIPTLQDLMGGSPPTLERPRVSGPHGCSFPLDASLGVDGTPQSGTGQATLLTGVNAAREFGRHFGPWTPVALRPLVEERSVLRRARDAGLDVAFANAYARTWPGKRRARRIAGPPLAARGAGLLTRHEEHLARAEAVTSEITNAAWQQHLGHETLPDVTPQQAGANLARIAAASHLTLYAYYATDTVGHRGTIPDALRVLGTLDGFLEGLLSTLPASQSLILTSDHGNLEHIPGGHTRNPALALAAGPAAAHWARTLTSITDVTGAILTHLGAAA